MVKPTALDGSKVPLNPFHGPPQGDIVNVHHLVAVGGEYGEVAVIEVDHLARVREDCRGVGGEEVLLLAHADEQRASLARRDDLGRVLAAYNRDAEGAFNLPQCTNHRLFQ